MLFSWICSPILESSAERGGEERRISIPSFQASWHREELSPHFSWGRKSYSTEKTTKHVTVSSLWSHVPNGPPWTQMPWSLSDPSHHLVPIDVQSSLPGSSPSQGRDVLCVCFKYPSQRGQCFCDHLGLSLHKVTHGGLNLVPPKHRLKF